jgi:hypothetical protein
LPPPKAALLAGLAAILLAGCAGAPWVDTRREGGEVETVGRSKPGRPVICFAPGETSAAELQAMAQTVCDETGGTARWVGVERWQCRMMTPHRAIFTCQ